MSYVVNDETIRLNQEATELAAKVRRVRENAQDLWARIQRDLATHQDMMIDLGSCAYQQMAKEAELREVVERG